MKFKKTIALGLGALMAAGASVANLSCVLADEYSEEILKTLISEQEAKNIMTGKVPGATIVKFELDEDDGVLKYEAELVKDGVEYDIEVNAKTGAIVEFEKDVDDIDDIDDKDDDDDDYDGIITGGVNLRSGASTKYKKIGYLKKGTKVEIEKRTSNGWYKVEVDDLDLEGYVSGKYVQVINMDDIDYTDDKDDDDDAVVISGVNVRRGPSTKYKKVGYLKKGTKVDIEKKMSNGWYKIEVDDSDLEGYVSGKCLKVYNDDLFDDDYDAIVTGGVNVRSGASVKYKKVGYLKKGTKVEIEKKMSNGWYKIEVEDSDLEGYVSGKYLQIVNADFDNDDDDDDAIITGGVNVRSGASVKYKKIGYLKKGTKVEIEKKMSNGWYKVECGDLEGYVSGKYVKML